jgi:chaperone required for assembly of F1-ATPase
VPVADEIATYRGSDLVCYRADTPEGLVAAQAQHWNPVLAWAREVHGARFVLSEGVMFVAQPESAISAVRNAIPSDPWRLGSVHLITTLTGSALIALAVAARKLGLDEAWSAAHVDEDWNMKLWGRDELALARRAARFADMQAAGTVLALTEGV